MVNIMRPLCTMTTILAGIWQMGMKLDEAYDPWKTCPRSLSFSKSQTKDIAGQDALADQPVKYSCLKHPYTTATYETPHCLFLPIFHAMNILSSHSSVTADTFNLLSSTAISAADSLASVGQKNANHSTWNSSPHQYTSHKSNHSSVVNTRKASSNSVDQYSRRSLLSRSKTKTKSTATKRIIYIGDSLVTETYLSASCLIEHYRFSHTLQVSYRGEVFLRDDIPCDPKCINNATMYLPYQGELRNPCWACSDGKLRTWDEFLKRPSSYINRIPNDTIAIVIGGGTWYNGYKGLIDSSAAYADTLRKLQPVMKHWIEDRNISVFWQGLVPTIPEHLVSMNVSALYEWAFFEEKDTMARKMLEPIGVTFVNVSSLTRERKRQDIYLTADPVHWCSPGLHSIPSFLNHVYLHLLASKLISPR